MGGRTLLPPPGPGCCTIGRAEQRHRNQVGKPQEGGKASGGCAEVAGEASSPEQGPGLHESPWHGSQPSLASFPGDASPWYVWSLHRLV